MKIFKIYKYTNLITGMSYIGQTCKPLSTRAGHNMQNYCGCEKFWEAIQNYGTDCWSVEFLWDGLTLDEANIYEQIEIKDNETLYPYGYNVSLGGFNATHSPDTRAKISKNNGRYFKDKKFTKEHCRKLRENHAMKQPEFRARHNKRLKENNPAHRPEVKAKHSKRMSENNPMKNLEIRKKAHKKCSETQLGMSQEALIILIQWLTRDGWSLRKISRELGKSKDTIFKYAKLAKERQTPP